MIFICMIGSEAGEAIEVGVKGAELVLDGGEVNWNSDVNVRHFSSNGADRIENYLVRCVRVKFRLDGRVNKEYEESKREN